MVNFEIFPYYNFITSILHISHEFTVKKWLKDTKFPILKKKRLSTAQKTDSTLNNDKISSF